MQKTNQTQTAIHPTQPTNQINNPTITPLNWQPNNHQNTVKLSTIKSRTRHKQHNKHWETITSQSTTATTKKSNKKNIVPDKSRHTCNKVKGKSLWLDWCQRRNSQECDSSNVVLLSQNININANDNSPWSLRDPLKALSIHLHKAWLVLSHT